MPRATRNSMEDTDDQEKSIDDWKQQSSESLKLKCGQLKLVTGGTKAQMAKRLVKHFEKLKEQAQNQDGNVPQVDLHSGSATDADIQFQIHSNKENINITNSDILAELRSMNNRFQELEERQEQQDHHLDRVMKLQCSYDDAIHQKKREEHNITQQEQQQKLQQQKKELLQKQQNQQYQLQQHQTQQYSQQPTYQNSSHHQQLPSYHTTSQNQMTHDTLGAQNQMGNSSASVFNAGDNSNPVSGFTMPPFMQDQAGSSTLTGRCADSSVPRNKFLPPPISKSARKAIENNEYVDFEDLLPGINPTLFTKDDHNIDVDQVSSTLKLTKKNKQGRILILAHWMVSWNRYMQANLAIRPHMYYELVKYQQHICEYASQYKFEACYSYDIDFRLSMAAQMSVDPAYRSVKWEEKCIEIENRHLKKTTLLSICDHCHCTGHIQMYCPVQKKESKNRQKQCQSQEPQHESQGNLFRSGQEDAFRNAGNRGSFWSDQRSSGSSRNGNESSPASSQQSGQYRPICHRYNRGTQCDPPCDFRHVCNRCDATFPENMHPGHTCTNPPRDRQSSRGYGSRRGR